MLQFFKKDVNNIFIELTNKCRLSCPSCTRTPLGKRLELKDLGQKHIEDLLAYYTHDEKQVLKMFLSGVYGDPIYHAEFLEIFAFLKKEGISVSVVTNGSGKDEEFWKKLSSLTDDKDIWYFSIDGLKDTNHIYRINGNFQESFDAMVMISKTKAKVLWKYLVFPHNKHQLQEAEEMAKSIGVEFLINYTDRTDNPKKYIMEGEEWKPELLKSKERNKFILKKIYPKYDGPLKDIMKIVPKCIDGNEVLFLSSKGYLMPCCRSVTETEGGGKNGDLFNENYTQWSIHEKTFKEISEHPFYVGLERLVKDTPEKAPYICQKNCGKATELGKKLIAEYYQTKQPSEK